MSGPSLSSPSLPASYRCAAVTGGSRGIGLAVARRLAQAGLAVHVIARESEALRQLAGEGMTPHPLDIADTACLAGLLREIGPDVLVNNAGHVHRAAALHELPPAEIDRLIDVNLRAPLHAMRACLPAMVARRRGHVVNLGSVAAQAPFGGMALYGGAKAAMHFLGDALRFDLAGSNVRVTTISPGRVDTDIHAQASGGSLEAMRAALYEGYRVLHASDVADAVMFALGAPEHVDVSFLALASTDQAVGGGRFERPPPLPN